MTRLRKASPAQAQPVNATPQRSQIRKTSRWQTQLRNATAPAQLPNVVQRQGLPYWRWSVNCKIRQPKVLRGDSADVAAMFGLAASHEETLYDGLELGVSPGEIVAVTGPSGAGKSVLLREAAKVLPNAVELGVAAIARNRRPAIQMLSGGTLRQRMAVLSRCGLADATAMITPARRLSGGQQYRLALAVALHRATRRGRPVLVIADEFCSTLDTLTARTLCRQMHKLVRQSDRLAMLVATPRAELLEDLRPDVTVVKRLGEKAEIGNAECGVRNAECKPPSAGRERRVPRLSRRLARPCLMEPGPGSLSCTRGSRTAARANDARLAVAPGGAVAPSGAVAPGGAQRCDACDSTFRIPHSAFVTFRTPNSAFDDVDIVPGTIADYDALGQFHYLAGRPAAHKRVYVARPSEALLASLKPAERALVPRCAGVLVVSPPVLQVRARNLALPGRYTPSTALRAGPSTSLTAGPSTSLPSTALRAGPSTSLRAGPLAWISRLNAELECISRVIVHPAFRGGGLAVRLVRHALADARTPMVEALAAMGAVHPFFELAGMEAFSSADPRALRLLSAAQAVGLSRRQVAAVEPVRAAARSPTPRGRFLQKELEIYMKRSIGERRLARLADPVAEACRKASRQYVYYLGRSDVANSEKRRSE